MEVQLKLDKEKYIIHMKGRSQIINTRRVLDKIEIVLNRHTIESTDFMDPYERKLAKSILSQFMDISYKEFGGLDNSERKTIVIYPDYYRHEDIQTPIESLMLKGYIDNLTHRDFLGAILNLGINRDKVGDILIHRSHAQLVVKSEIANFISMNLERIGRERIKVSKIKLSDIQPGEIDYKEKFKTVSSLRLDVIISSVLNISRNDSKKIILTERVKVNWEPIDRIFKELEEGDMISVKGYGRFKLQSIEGISRKGKPQIKFRLLN